MNFKSINRKSFILTLAAVLGVSVIVTSVAGRTSDNSVPADNKNINTTQPSLANSKQPTVIVTGETADISIECNEIKIITPSEATAEELVKSKWSSSDNNIVTVDDGGRIDGLSEGTARQHPPYLQYYGCCSVAEHL